MAGGGLRVTDRLLGIFAQESAKPADPFAADDVVGVDPPLEVGNVGDVPADDDLGLGKMLADQLAHLLHLQQVRQDAADAHDVVGPAADLLDEAVQGGKVQERARRVEVRLDQHQAPGAMEQPQ